MAFGKRLLITLAAMVIASFVVGLLWRGDFDARIPSYLSGPAGGLSALATWELLRAKKIAKAGRDRVRTRGHRVCCGAPKPKAGMTAAMSDDLAIPPPSAGSRAAPRLPR